MNQIKAPFEVDQVTSINDYQHSCYFHELTCGNDSNHQLLVADQEGLKCPDCDYTQDWVHDWIADWSWHNMMPRWDRSTL